MDVYGTKSVIQDSIIKTQHYLKSMENNGDAQQPPPLKQPQPPPQTYGTATLKSVLNNNNINNNNTTMTNNNTISGTGNKSNKSRSPSQFENDYQSITEWTHKLCLERREEDMERTRVKERDEREEEEDRVEREEAKEVCVDEKIYDKDGDCVKIRSKGICNKKDNRAPKF